MDFAQPLQPGTLLRRYKRFLADVMLDDGTEVTAHCANPGAMLGLNAPGTRVWLEPVASPPRKLAHAWRLVELPAGGFAGIDASLPNGLVAEALAAGHIPAAAGYASIRREVPYGTGNRVDFLLEQPGRPRLWLEVKNVHLCRTDGWAEFPDCVTARGARHLGALAAMVAAGDRAMLLYVVQRTDCTLFRLAADLDPAYARAAATARAAGVEMVAHATTIDPEGVRLLGPIPIGETG